MIKSLFNNLLNLFNWLKIVKAKFGSILKETDIVKYQDVYGRVK